MYHRSNSRLKGFIMKQLRLMLILFGLIHTVTFGAKKIILLEENTTTG